MASRARSIVRLVMARLAQGAALLLALSFALFALLAHLPGDPIDLLVASNPELRPADVLRLKKLRGLDQPFHVRWWRWLVGYHDAVAPPGAVVLPPVFAEADGGGLSGQQVRLVAVRVPLDGVIGVTRALPPATLEAGALTALAAPGAHRLTAVVIDRLGQEAPVSVIVYVAPADVDAPPPPQPGDPTVIDDDGSDPQQAGGTEAAPVRRTNAEIMAAALVIAAPQDIVERDGEHPGQRVVVDERGVVSVERGDPLTDPDRFVCGVVCAFGDADALGWSFATKRPVKELLFGRDSVCGDFVTEPGEACDDGNVRDGDGCDAKCAQEDPRHTPIERADIAVAGALTSLGRIGNTLLLTVPSLALAMLISLALGAFAARRGGGVDKAITFGAAVVSATPAFFIALLLVTLFAEQLRLLPSSGVFRPGVHQDGAWEVIVERARHAVLPIVVLTLFWSGRFVRQVRSAVIAALASDAVRTARMIGASEWRVMRVHVLPNAALPLVTLVGLSLPSLFGGALLTETVFAWPGLGRLQYDAILQNDSYVAIVVFLLSAAMVLAGSLFADVAARLIDPRIGAHGAHHFATRGSSS